MWHRGEIPLRSLNIWPSWRPPVHHKNCSTHHSEIHPGKLLLLISHQRFQSAKSEDNKNSNNTKLNYAHKAHWNLRTILSGQVLVYTLPTRKPRIKELKRTLSGHYVTKGRSQTKPTLSPSGFGIFWPPFTVHLHNSTPTLHLSHA